MTGATSRFFEGRRRRAGHKKKMRERFRREEEQRAYRNDLDLWEEERARLARNLALAQKPDSLKKEASVPLVDVNTALVHRFSASKGVEIPDRIDLKLGFREFIIGVMPGCGQLIEVTAEPGELKGGIGAVSIGYGGVSVGVGRHGGHIEPGEVGLKTTDRKGDVIVTNRRVVYKGQMRIVRWSFRRMDDMEHTGFATYFTTTDREYVSGIGYPMEYTVGITSRLQLGMALATGQRRELVKELEEGLAAYDETRPQPPSV